MLLRNSLHIHHLPKEAKLFKRKHVTTLITYSLVFFSAISMTACSFSDVSYLFKSPAQKQAILHKSPAFWEDTTSVKGSSNLSILHNVAFEGRPYNDTRQFGDNILMVGQGSYNNSILEPPYLLSITIYRKIKLFSIHLMYIIPGPMKSRQVSLTTKPTVMTT